MLRGLFRSGRGRAGRDGEAAERVKDAARAALGAPDVELTVSEIECLDPACPGFETVILVLRPGRRTQAVKIPRAMADVTPEEVRAALGEPEKPR